MNRLVNKLLRRHVNAWQLAGFVLANLCGMAIVLTAVQFFSDLKPLLTGNDSFMRPGHIVVTKRVSTVGTFTGASTAFSEDEIDDIEEQPFVQKLGRYTPALFTVFATIGGGSLPVRFSTDMFFEAMPDEFLDVDLKQWSYNPDTPDVPIILPRTYLNLYNFGFASSQGLPTVSEDIVGAITINLRLSGTTTVLKTGHVVAFSRRLNTILVPQAFMDDMNRQLAPDRQPQPSRLIVNVANPADERIADYLEKKGFDTEAADTDASRAASLMRVITTVVLVVGLIISILAFYVLLLSIFLLLQKHTEKIDNLLLIGYTPGSVARPFHLLTIILNVVVLLGALLAVVIIRGWYLPLFGELYAGFEPTAFVPTLLTGLAILLIVSIINYTAITRKVKAIWHMHE
ncbi:MAG: ABC transporter permease [Prevotella sp.]|nr:ABC transporter permease [Prevotella sp.]